MILKTDRKKLQKFILPRYTEDVLQILKEKKVLNNRKNEHSAEYVTLVWIGHRNNKDVELAIYELFHMRNLANQKRKEMLRTKKPVATTTG